MSLGRVQVHSALDNNISDPTPGKTASVTTVELLPEQVYHNGHHQSYTTADREQSVTALDLQATHLISSPYSDFTNQLDLQRLGLQDRLFALALTSLAPLRPDYATAPYMSTFNWPIVFAHLRALCAQFGLSWERQEFYLVIFRSQLSRGIDRTRLGELDKESHREACESGGLLKYWFGSCDGEMRNLATCIWRNRADAAAGGGGPWHKQARKAAREMYESISFYTHKLVIEADAEQWRLDEYVD